MKLFILFFLCFHFSIYAQDQNNLFFETELQVGKITPNTSSHPSTKANIGTQFNIGIKQNGNRTWGKFYNHPELGVSIGYNYLGEKNIFGNEYSIYPFFSLPTSKNPKKGVHIKIGYGLSLFNKKYHKIENPENLWVGSNITYAFNLSIHKSFILQQRLRLKAGLTFRHSSNGHTTLPNYGVNSALVSLILQYFPKGVKESSTLEISPSEKKYHYFLITNQGIGLHELGGPTQPIGGKKGIVSTTGIFGAVLFKKHILVRAGFSYRYYQIYRDYIDENQLAEYNNNPAWNSSNIIFSIGSEFLIGHFSLDIQGGLNIYKPFYETHYLLFENTKEYDRITKSLFNTKFGLNVYLFNTSKLPKHNLRMGIFINANFGQADFAELGIGYVHKIQ